MNSSRPALVLLCLALSATAEPQAGTAGVLERYEFSAGTMTQWKLPGKLNEISGLALTADERLLAVTDERAIVYELDYAEGRLVKAFALGNPTVRGDFEGIAYSPDRVWLVTSDGTIFSASEGEDGERVEFDRFETGLGKLCEIEGLAYRKADAMLLLLCKNVRNRSVLDSLVIFAWSTATHEVVEGLTIPLPDREIANALRNNRFNPSGLVIDAATGHLVIVAARQHALVELDAAGGFVAGLELPLSARHRQAEGIEILGSGELLIADEGGPHKARLAIYRPGTRPDIWENATP